MDDTAHDVDETPRQRRNRQLIELLNELRVALLGVQILFAVLWFAMALVRRAGDPKRELEGVEDEWLP